MLAFALLLAVASPAQEAPSAEPRERPVVRVSLDLVQVDAVVTDPAGRYVDDLRCEDFEIFEDKKPQAISNCSYIRAAGAAPAAETAVPSAGSLQPHAMRREDVRRTIVLVVDDLRLDLQSVVGVRRALENFIEHQIEPGDLASIVLTSSGTGALQQFTADKNVLHAGAKRVRYNMAADPAGFKAPGIESYIPRPEGPGGLDFERVTDAVFTNGTVGTLRFVLTGLRSMPGRKSLVFFSTGYPLLYKDRGRGKSVRTAFALAVPGIVDLANRASTVLYTVDALGVFTALPNADQADPGDASMLSTRNIHGLDGLAALSDPTGGLLLRGSNDLGSQIGRVLEDQKGYYRIGYVPSEASLGTTPDDRPLHHDVEVKVRREGLQVRTRSGFYAEGAAAEGGRDPEGLAGALQSPFGSDAIHLELRSLFFRDARQRPMLHSFLRVDLADITTAVNGRAEYVSRLEIAAFTFDAEGNAVDRLSRSGELLMTRDAHDRARREGIRYVLDVPIKKAGDYQLRVAVRDSASGRVGSAYQFVEVPDLGSKHLVLSGLLLTKGDDDDARTFAPGQQLAYGLTVYNARLDPRGRDRLQMRMRLLREGQEIVAGQPRDVEPGDGKGERLVGGAFILPAGLAPGVYELQVTVTDALEPGALRAAAQVATFEVAHLHPPGVSE